VQNDDIEYQRNSLYYWNQLRKQVLNTHKGQYVVVGEDKAPIFTHNYTQALIKARRNDFIGWIGYEGHEKDVISMLLMSSEIPPKQPEEMQFSVAENVSLPFLPRGLYTSRLFFVIPVLTENREYHGVTFLYDTGAPTTWLERETRKRLRIFDQIVNNVYKDYANIDICGIPIRAYFSEDCPNPHAQNINVIGRDFVRTCKVIDHESANFLSMELQNKVHRNLE